MDDISYLDPETIGGANLFAYCNNNPITNADPKGHAWYNVLWDWVNTAAGVLNPISTITVVGSIVVAAIDGRWSDVVDDWNNGRLNPFNQNATIANEAKVLSFYKGSTVVKQNVIGTCSILGTIWSNTNDKTVDIMHEYGHSVQERILGLNYLTRIALPSVVYMLYDSKIGGTGKDYYSTPWERTADWFGGVKENRNFEYKHGSLAWSILENLLGHIVTSFYFWFGY